MKSKRLVFLLFIVLCFAGCNIGGLGDDTPTQTQSPLTATGTPANTAGITPNITHQPTGGITPNVTQDTTPSTTVAPTATITATTTTAKPTEDPDLSQKTQLVNSYLPPLDTNLRFFGIAETGHYGQLSKKHEDDGEAMYQFDGTYDDGMGVPHKFKIQYFINYYRGTVTEKAISNERLNKAEFHSKLHNIVALKFPLSLGSTWSHATNINGSQYWVYAEVIEYDGNKIKVMYTAPNVPDYYNDTYIEIRTFEKNYGLTTFANIMPGDLDMTGVDTSDEDAVMDHIMNMHMFGYSLDKQN